MVVTNCWHRWHRIDTALRGLSGWYTATTTVMVCLDLCTWSSQSMPQFFGALAASLSQLRLAPNRPCMSLVIGNEYIYLLCLVTLQEFVYTSMSVRMYVHKLSNRLKSHYVHASSHPTES